jgi:hypothetical protein
VNFDYAAQAPPSVTLITELLKYNECSSAGRVRGYCTEQDSPMLLHVVSLKRISGRPRDPNAFTVQFSTTGLFIWSEHCVSFLLFQLQMSVASDGKGTWLVRFVYSLFNDGAMKSGSVVSNVWVLASNELRRTLKEWAVA